MSSVSAYTLSEQGHPDHYVPAGMFTFSITGPDLSVFWVKMFYFPVCKNKMLLQKQIMSIPMVYIPNTDDCIHVFNGNAPVPQKQTSRPIVLNTTLFW